MSYNLIKNVKIVKTENGFNFSCQIASSNLRDAYTGKRVYEPVDRLYKNDAQTKNELKFTLFRDWYNGEIHTGYFNRTRLNRLLQVTPELKNRCMQCDVLWNKRFETNYGSEEREQANQIYSEFKAQLEEDMYKLYTTGQAA